MPDPRQAAAQRSGSPNPRQRGEAVQKRRIVEAITRLQVQRAQDALAADGVAAFDAKAINAKLARELVALIGKALGITVPQTGTRSPE